MTHGFIEIEDFPTHQKAVMTTLILSNQNLSRLPTQLPFKSKKLEHLDISNNRIDRLPNSISQWTCLTSFIAGNLFGGNLLTSFPPTSLFPNLRVLDVSNNLLQSLIIDSYVYLVNAQRNELKSIIVSGQIHTLNLQDNYFETIPVINADVIDITNNPIKYIMYEMTRKHLICRSLKEQSTPKDVERQFSLLEMCKRQLKAVTSIRCNVCSCYISEYHSIYVKRASLPIEYKCCSTKCITKIKP